MKKIENQKIERHWLNDRTGHSDFTSYRQHIEGWTEITGLISSIVISQTVSADEMNPVYIQCVINDRLTAKKTLLYADVINYKENKVDKKVLAARYFHQELLLAAHING